MKLLCHFRIRLSALFAVYAAERDARDYLFEVDQPIYWDNSDMIKSCFHSMHSAMWDIINSPQVRGISYVPTL